MTDIEALRARMREAAEKAMAATSDNWFHGEYSDIEYAPPAGDENGAHWFPLADELAPAVCDYLIAAQPSATIAIDAYTTRLRDDLDRVTRERDEAREAVDADEQVIAERDSYHEWADKLAHAVGGLEVGEHSNINNPWHNAIEMAETLHARAEAAEAALSAAQEEVARMRAVMRETSEYLRKLEGNMLANDADMMLDDCLPPSFHADQIDQALTKETPDAG